MIPFNKPYMTGRELEYIRDAVASGKISGDGMFTKKCHAWLEAKLGTGRAFLTSSCTDALEAAALLCDVGPGDEVIMPSYTFVSTANAFALRGATIRFVDSSAAHPNLDASRIEELVTPRTRVIAPVHYAGMACDMDAIMSIAQKHNLKVIEDCAHAIETEYKGQKAGTFGDFGCFSFYSTKNIVTGEGGMVLAKRDEDIARIKVLGLHGMSKDAWKRFGDEGFKHYQVVECGFKYNMMDMQAALGIHQLRRVEAYWRRRSQIWQRYMEAFRSLPIGLPAQVEENTRHAYHLFTIMIDEEKTGLSRDRFLDRMTAEGVGVGVHYLSLPEHPYYQKTFGWKPEDYPHAMRIGRQIVSLPISAKLTEADEVDVIYAVTKCLTA